jgi:chemotaxis response regulator CheB
MRRILVVDDFRPWRELAREIIEAQPDLQVIAQA